MSSRQAVLDAFAVDSRPLPVRIDGDDAPAVARKLALPSTKFVLLYSVADFDNLSRFVHRHGCRLVILRRLPLASVDTVLDPDAKPFTLADLLEARRKLEERSDDE